MSTETESLTCIETKYHIRYTNENLMINGEPISYGPQILDLDKLYIISTNPQSKLRTPIVLDRTNEVDELDRKIFTRNFLLEIVKGMEISSFDDAMFIMERVPKLIKYFVGLVQKISLTRWIQLLNNNSFFLALYQTLDNIISRRDISKLRADYIEEIIQVHLKTTYSRIYYLMDNLVLENQNLRNSIVNLARQIVLKEFQEKKFFEVNLLGKPETIISEEESQNSGVQDNNSETDSIPEDKEIPFPEKFLQNTIRIVKSCQKLKIQKDTITQKILNERFFKLLKYFFQTFFQRQRCELLEILALASQIEPMKLWKITFEEGRTVRCKTLLYLESLLTNSMISYSEGLKKPTRTKKFTSQGISKEVQKENSRPIQSSKYWEFTSVVIEKFIVFQSPERKTFLNRILNTLLTCKMIHEELDFILVFLESSSKDDVYLARNKEIWRMIVKKIESWLCDCMKGKTKKDSETNGGRKKNGAKKNANKTMIIGSDDESSILDIICQEDQTTSSIFSQKQAKEQQISLKLPMSKSSIIKAMKIYKILIKNEKKFEIVLDPECLMYLIDVTERRKGVIEGVRLTLIDMLGKGESLMVENLDFSHEESRLD